jgi:Co/Zn/Cd efflux system component
MAAHVCSHDTPSPERMTNLPRYRLILWVAVVVNAAMFVVELRAGFSANSLSLWADAIDFGGDALNYGMSLAVLTSAIAWRARVALFKGSCMMGLGVGVLVHAVWSAWRGEVPEPLIMGSVAVVALVANVGVAWMLYAFREGDANMRSVWLCSRNDAIGNVAVLAAAGGVLGSGSAWPDLLVASAMASLALTSGWQVLKLARQELAA